MKKTIHALLFGLVAAAGLPAYATPISTVINLDTVYTGTTPTGTAPWLTAQFTSSTGSKTGTLTLTSHLNGDDFLQGPNLGWGFYLNPEVSSFTCTSGNCADHVGLGSGQNGGPTGSNWNLAFEWQSGGRFLSGQVATYTINFNTTLADSPFIPTPIGKNKKGGWLSAAHVQGIGTAGCSGWIVSGDGQGATGDDGKCSSIHVPEPSVLGMFGLGTLVIGLFAGLSRRQRQDRRSSSV